MLQPLLVFIGGKLGTGKTTLARLLVAELRAAYLRTDAIVLPILRGVERHMNGKLPGSDTTWRGRLRLRIFSRAWLS